LSKPANLTRGRCPTQLGQHGRPHLFKSVEADGASAEAGLDGGVAVPLLGPPCRFLTLETGDGDSISELIDAGEAPELCAERVGPFGYPQLAEVVPCWSFPGAGVLTEFREFLSRIEAGLPGLAACTSAPCESTPTPLRASRRTSPPCAAR
jgi:hypothetical protein